MGEVGRAAIDDVGDAQRLLNESNPCSIEELDPINKLIRRYGNRPEPELRLIVARARLQTGSAFWFREHSREANRWFIGVVRIYGREEGVEFQRLVARAQLMLAKSVRDRSQRAQSLERLIASLGRSNDPEILETYAVALYDLSGIEAESGNQTQAEILHGQASETFRTRVTPHLPPVDEDARICV